MTHYWQPCHSLCHSSPLTHDVFQPHGDVSNPVTGNFFNLWSNGSLVSLHISMMHCTLYINCCKVWVDLSSSYIGQTLRVVLHILNRWLDPERQIPHGRHSWRSWSSQSTIATCWRDVLKETRCARTLDSAQIFICSFIYLFIFQQGPKTYNIFFFCLHMCVCVRAKRTRGWFFFATCAVVCN